MKASNSRSMHSDRYGTKERVAVFVDVENVLGWLKRGGCGELLAKAADLGVVSIRRAFGDFSNPTVASRQEELQKHGFDLVHTLHPAKAKSNSADISMTLDVMEYCRGPEIQWVMLATGDSDFSPVFRRLRELGKGVIGVGPASVLSESVSLSCHEFILTNSDGKGRSISPHKGSGNNHSTRKKGRGRGDLAWNTGGSAASTVNTTRVTPPQLFSARGGFRVKQSGAGRAVSLRMERDSPEKSKPKTILTEQTQQPIEWKQVDSSKISNVEEGCSLKSLSLSPGELLTPRMLAQDSGEDKDAELLRSHTPSRRKTLSTNASRGIDVTSPIQTGSYHETAVKSVTDALTQDARKTSSTSQSAFLSSMRHTAKDVVNTDTIEASTPLAGVSRCAQGPTKSPSEGLYRHLLSVDTSPDVSARKSTSDWGIGVTEATLAKGLACLAGACGGQDKSHHGAVQAIVKAVGHCEPESGRPDGCARGGGVDESTGPKLGMDFTCGPGFERDEACRVVGLLQRCGFLTWLADEQQWMITVPADLEILRRRRDDVLLEELTTRCSEAGVVFEPQLASTLLWSHNNPRTGLHG